MFGWSVHTVGTSGRLVITDPSPISATFWASLFTFCPLIYLLLQRLLAVRRVVLFCVAILVVFSFVLDSATLTLDSATGTMRISRFALYHWWTQTLPLNTLDHAYPTTGKTTARITLQTHKTEGPTHFRQQSDGGQTRGCSGHHRFIGLTN